MVQNAARTVKNAINDIKAALKKVRFIARSLDEEREKKRRTFRWNIVRDCREIVGFHALLIIIIIIVGGVELFRLHARARTVSKTWLLLGSPSASRVYL